MALSVPDDSTGSIGRSAHCGNWSASSRRTSDGSVSTSLACIFPGIGGTIVAGNGSGRTCRDGGVVRVAGRVDPCSARRRAAGGGRRLRRRRQVDVRGAAGGGAGRGG